LPPSLRQAQANGSFERRFRALASVPLLIPGDFGLKPLRPPEDETFHDRVAGGAGQGDQSGFLGTIQTAGIHPLAGLGHPGRRQPVLDEALPDPFDRPHTDIQHGRDLGIGAPGAALGFVRLQQNPGMGEPPGLTLACADQPFQPLPLFRGQRDPIPLRHLRHVAVNQPPWLASSPFARQLRFFGFKKNRTSA
jgi:hypothetical protein